MWLKWWKLVTCKYIYSPTSACFVEESVLISKGLELLLLNSSASLENLLSTSSLLASKLFRRPCLDPELRITISDSVFSRRGLKKSSLGSRKKPMLFKALILLLGELLECSVFLLTNSVSTGSPFVRQFNPVMFTSEPRRLLNMPLDLKGLTFRSKMAECLAELRGKKSEFSRRKPRNSGFETFASLSTLRWDVMFFSLSLILTWVIDGECLSFGLDGESNLLGKKRAMSQSLSNVASSISGWVFSSLWTWLCADCCYFVQSKKNKSILS